MAPIPGKFCEDCAEDGDQTPAETEWDARYQDSGGLFLCERHADRRIGAYERAKADDFHGGSAPFSIQELAEAAGRERRELRRLD